MFYTREQKKTNSLTSCKLIYNPHDSSPVLATCHDWELHKFLDVSEVSLTRVSLVVKVKTT